MAIITQIEVEVSGFNRYEYVVAKQGDNGSRYIQIHLMNNGNVYVLDSRMKARAFITKPDKKEVLKDCEINGNYVELELDNNILAVAGTGSVEIVLTSGGTGDVLTSAEFDLKILASKKTSGAESSNDYSSLKDGLLKLDGVATKKEVGEDRKRIDGLERNAATKQEVDVERRRIDNLSSSTTEDGELIDIRIGTDGKRYGSAGAAVRGQVGALKEKVEDICTFVEPMNIFDNRHCEIEMVDGLEITYEKGYAAGYDISQHEGIVTDGARYISYMIPVHGGKTLYFFWGSTIVRYNMFYVYCYDKDKNFIERNSTSGVTEYTIPEETCYIRLLMQVNDWLENGYQMVTYTDVVGTKYYEYFDSYNLIKDGIANVLSMGAMGDGMTDDYYVIQNALNTYDTVYLPSTDKGYAISKPLKLNINGQRLYGDSFMMLFDSETDKRKRSAIMPTDDFVGDNLIEIPHDIYGCMIERLVLTKCFSNPDLMVNGIDMNNGRTNEKSRGYHVLKDVTVYNVAGNGIVCDYYSWDNKFENVNVKKCGKNAFDVSCTDSLFVGCYASDCGESGFVINKGANVLLGCKAYCNGKNLNIETAGMLINGWHTRIEGCNSQQNYTNGLIIKNSTCTVSGTVLDGNGWVNPSDKTCALKITAPNNILSSVMIIPHWLDGCVKYGVDISEGVKNIDAQISISEVFDWESSGKYEGFEEFEPISPTVEAAGNRIVINCEQLIG